MEQAARLMERERKMRGKMMEAMRTGQYKAPDRTIFGDRTNDEPKPESRFE